MTNALRGLALIVTLCAATAVWAGPVSPWYLTAGDQGTNWIVQGAAATSSPQAHSGESPIAVTDSVKTLKGGCVVLCGFGANYSLTFSYTGTDYASPARLGFFYDGASDGTNNYSVDYYYGRGGVYRFDANWANPSLLFTIDDVGANLGIAYDPSDGTLWISQFIEDFSPSLVRHYTLGGLLLGQFEASQSALTSLALDPADGTLWMGSQATKGTFYQYSKAGTLLDSVTFAGMLNQNTLGGEFAAGFAPPVLLAVVSRRVHGAAGTFDLPLGNVPTNPTTDPRQGPAQTIVLTFSKPVMAGTAAVMEGTATAGAPTFSGSEMRVPLTGVADQQYVTLVVSNVDAEDGGTGGSGSIRIGFLLGDVSQNRVVTGTDLGLVNAQIAQFVTTANYLNDVNASGTLSVADKAITNAQLTRSLPAPQ